MPQRRCRALKRGWVVVYILGILGFGGVVSGWTGPRSAELSASQTVAMRFPEDVDDEPTAANAAVVAGVLGTRRLALLDPALLDPDPVAPRAAAPAPAEPAQQPAISAKAEVRVPIVQPVVRSPATVRMIPAPSRVSLVKGRQDTSGARSSARPDEVASAPMPQPHLKPAPAPVHKVANRPGFVLNDAQIASIKRRLQLSPDQERMWPAVEAALRSIAYAKTHGEARRHHGAAVVIQTAGIDPNSPEVQGLKSAAVPLIMSFNSEQKSEVRTLAHVMGLDQLASQF